VKIKQSCWQTLKSKAQEALGNVFSGDPKGIRLEGRQKHAEAEVRQGTEDVKIKE